MKRIFIIGCLLCAALWLVACSSRRTLPDADDYMYEYHPTPSIQRLTYIALGDSVSEGFGIWSASDRHTTRFFDLLRTHGYANEYLNLAIGGYTTTDLLRLLDNPDAHALDAFNYAAVITLNIGGNNILAPVWAQLPAATEITRIAAETMQFATDAWGLVTDIMDFIDESRGAVMDVLDLTNDIIDLAENFTFMDIFRLNQIIATAPPIIDGAFSVFNEIDDLQAAAFDIFARANELDALDYLSLFINPLSDELQTQLQTAVQNFADEFVQILTWLQTHAPQATIIVNTVYNPLPTDLMGLPIGFVQEAEYFIHAVNRIIIEETQNRGFVVSDVYAQLSQRLDLMNLSFDIIHPNPAGHETIAQINFADLTASR